MRPAPPHPEESARLEVLAELDTLIRDGDPRLDNLTAIAAEVAGTPISAVSLVDFDQQYFVGRVGLDAPATARDVAFCAHTILGDDLFEVTDATRDDRFAANPLVTGDLHIRQYAGVPLLSDEGLPIGTLCVIGQRPGRLGDAQRRVLRRLALEVTAIVQSHRRIRDLEERDRAHRARMARVVHDLRAPLRSLFQLTRDLGPAPDPTTLGTIQLAAAQLQHVSDALLEGPEDAPVPTDLTAVFDAQASLVRPLVRPGVEVQAVVSPRVPASLLLPPVTLRRILSNLLSNAARFTDDGYISLLAEVSDDQLLIAVQDTGRGIPEDRRASVFAPGAVAAEGTGSQTGLGLAIVREKVEALGGTVTLDSAVGRGTRFTLRLPIVQATRAPVDIPFRVLVVDDVPLNRLVAERILIKQGFDATSAADGEEALAAFGAATFDAVLLDCFMPGLSGPDVTRRLRRRFGTALTICGWTGSDDAALAQRFQTAGADAVFHKPLDPAQVDRLVALVQRAEADRRSA